MSDSGEGCRGASLGTLLLPHSYGSLGKVSRGAILSTVQWLAAMVRERNTQACRHRWKIIGVIASQLVDRAMAYLGA